MRKIKTEAEDLCRTHGSKRKLEGISSQPSSATHDGALGRSSGEEEVRTREEQNQFQERFCLGS